MKSKILFLLMLSVYSYTSLQAKVLSKKNDTLYAERLKPMGRTIVNVDKQLELISSAANFGFQFRGESCEIYVSLPYAGAHNYLQYELDGVYQKRIRIEGNSNLPVKIKVAGSGLHTVCIYKATEAHTGAIMVSKVVAKNIRPIKIPKAPLIEFIGNSITCGAASDPSEYPCGTGEYHDQHNAYMAYGPRASRMLKVNYVMSSVSGIGIYRTWNTDGPSMPNVYEQLDFRTDSKTKWNFKTYTPKIVSIALGTNDFSNGDGKTPRKPFDQDLFIAQYVKFIQVVKSNYPDAQIALLSSPMVKEANGDLFEKLLTTIKSRVDALYPADKKVSTFFFPPMDAHGCTGHPSVADHLILAEQLYPFYNSLLNK